MIEQQIKHELVAIFNVGFEDDPDWKFVCDCGYESWGHGSEVLAEQIHRNHKALSTWGPYA